MWSRIESGTVAATLAACALLAASSDSLAQGDAKKAEQSKSTAAVQIIDARRLLEDDRLERESLEADLKRLDQSFEKSSNEFAEVDAKLRQAADGPEKAAIEKDWAMARDHFDAVIQSRHAVRRQIDTLGDKGTLVQGYLHQLTSIDPARPVAPAAAVAKAAGVSVEDTDHDDVNLVDARKKWEEAKARRRTAEAEVARKDHAIDVFERDIESTRDLLESARSFAKTEEAATATLDARLKERLAAKAPEAEIRELRERLTVAERRREAARKRVARQVARLAGSEAVLAQVRERRVDAARFVDEAESVEGSAQNRLLFFESPLAPHRLVRWLTHNGPKVVGTVVTIFVGWYLVRFLGHRVLAGLVRRRNSGSSEERTSRAETLRRAFQSATGIVFLVLGVLAVLDEAGIKVTVLLGGAAFFGAALAFGSQNLIKDYFTGFMILVENQYSVGHTIRIGDSTGTVEDITLRMLVLRDLQGVAHFIPHSQVAKVSNFTYGWSGVLLAIKVAADQDEERVMSMMADVARGLHDDPEFSSQIIGPPQMLGVDSLDGPNVSIKLLMKTRPLSRWRIKRELLRRMSKVFADQGIKSL